MTDILSKLYISGVGSALQEAGICEFDNFAGAMEKVAADLSGAIGAQPPSQDPSQAAAMQAMQPPPGQPPGAGGNPGAGGGDQAAPEEVDAVGQSGLTDKDIEGAAKVVQVLAEMKQQADAKNLGMQQAQAQAPAGGAGQPPLPPPPQAQGSQMPPAGAAQ
jgi:hypothetical protein